MGRVGLLRSRSIESWMRASTQPSHQPRTAAATRHSRSFQPAGSIIGTSIEDRRKPSARAGFDNTLLTPKPEQRHAASLASLGFSFFFLKNNLTRLRPNPAADVALRYAAPGCSVRLFSFVQILGSDARASPSLSSPTARLREGGRSPLSVSINQSCPNQPINQPTDGLDWASDPFWGGTPTLSL